MTIAMPKPVDATRKPPRNTRDSITTEDLTLRLDEIQRDLADIAVELKALNADYYLPSSIQPLVVAATRQSGFAADHASNALLLLSAMQQKESAQ